jgi:hypothetical protein
METTDRALLEAAAATPVEGQEGQWLWLVQEFLGLDGNYIPAVQRALQQGRWRNAKAPKAYVKTVAKREAIKMGLVDNPIREMQLPEIRNPEGQCLSDGQVLDHLLYDDGPVKEGGKWKARTGSYDPNDYNEDGERITPRERLVGRLPIQLTKPNEISGAQPFERFGILMSSSSAPDWTKIAKAADLDKGEEQVLEYKLRDISRDMALALQPSETKRKQLQAAWRRFDRNGMEKLRLGSAREEK